MPGDPAPRRQGSSIVPDDRQDPLAAPVVAGGRIVRHNVEEGFWTLSDAAGNEVAVAMTSPPDPAA
jgi:hypothetical protein